MKRHKRHKEDYDRLPRMPALKEALIPLAFLIVILMFSIIWLEIDPHIPLILSAGIAALVASKIGVEWDVIEKGVLDGIMVGMQAMVILMIVGMLIGSWMQSGIVPLMIYWGLQLISPQIFLVASALITAIVALFVGSSWSTAGTIGVALVGIGTGLGISPGLVGGSIISGAYLGDKLSPLSDTTNLAPGSAGDTEVFEHIRHMLYVTVPGFIIALIMYGIIGLGFAEGAIETGQVSLITETLAENFNLNPLLFLAPVFVLTMIVLKVPPIPALLGGAVLGGIFAMIFQGEGLGTILDTMHYGFVIETEAEMVDDLLTAGGLDGMMWTISLIFAALSFGGIMENCGFLAVILKQILSVAKTYGSLSLATHLTTIFVNLVTADQYLAIILPARMFNQAFKDMGAHPKNLSRIVESSGTITSPLIPWNTCGAFMYGALGINPLVFAPYAFFNWITPLLSIAYGYLGIGYADWEKEENI
ncbi:Na+/H+ antiporter NhaC [Halarsenatibacter silvermanii]|uniref:Na+:H+ antiporter, NhaC family n=1 Tax=Halarsenatibacter silvermanii TaxID=321763 RepID=A0A1G9S5P5_9FIRM|nr:Na+/H+ antiporter NhaC [Halarsenatibacter silvermanii]SDM30721.1 Na+:H+ antiporter, NhaC family [Halarsenatibacter silvermanii]